MEPEDLTERPTIVSPPYGYIDINNLKNIFQEQQEPISLAVSVLYFFFEPHV